MRRLSRAALFLLGFTSLLSQIILIRELLVVFYGNELSLGLILTCWLLWTALGSGLVSRWPAVCAEGRRLLPWALVAVSAVLPGVVAAIRLLRPLLGIVPGETLGLGAVLYVTLWLFAPLGLILGAIFTVACRIYAGEVEQTEDAARLVGRAVGLAYFFEASGAAVAGALFSYVLVFWLSHWQLVWGVVSLNLGLSLLFWYWLSQGRPGRRLSWPMRGGIMIALAALYLAFSPTGKNWDYYLRGLSWPGFTLLAASDSRYGNLVLVAQGEQHSLFENGLLAFSYPDKLSAEEAVHFGLLEHPHPERVLLIGGGIGGALEEILKHPAVKEVDYLELDPLTIELGRQALPPATRAALTDPRVRIKYVDGRAWLREIQINAASVNTPPRSYHVILVNLPHPYTAQLNRFYTREFFSQAAAVLTPDGVLAFSLGSSENYISPERAKLFASLRATLRDVFPAVLVLPGETIHFLSSKTPGALTGELKVLAERIKERNLNTKYIQEHFLRFRLSPERKASLLRALDSQTDVRPNLDFSPVAYYQNLELWLTYFSPRWKGVFLYLSRLTPIKWLAGLLLLALIAWFWGSRTYHANGAPQAKSRTWGNPVAPAVLYATACNGFLGLSLEIILLLAFQILFGYVYLKIGLLLAGFMLGMAGGSWLGGQVLVKSRWAYGVLVALELAQGGLALVLPYLFGTLQGITSQATWAEALLILTTVVCGTVDGAQFPLVNRFYHRAAGAGVAGSAGLTYSLDLLGSCVGALLVSAIILPLWGVNKTCLGVAQVAGVAAMFLLLAKIGEHYGRKSLR